jgi:hypothetical protein
VRIDMIVDRRGTVARLLAMLRRATIAAALAMLQRTERWRVGQCRRLPQRHA